MSTLTLNCLLLNDDSRKAFTVKIPESENVSVLKKKIKEENAPHFDHLAASDLSLYKASFPSAEVDALLEEATAGSKENFVVPRIPLQPLKKLKEVFPEPLQEDIVHIIFKYGHGMCSRH
jgi:Crinkler effector protein N-terminal domain